jgi:hypothetical protein
MNMANPSPRDADGSSAPSSSTALLMIGTVADTTWRLFVPTLGGTSIGIWAGSIYDIRSWAVIAGVVVGFLISAGLIYMQLRKVKN